MKSINVYSLGDPGTYSYDVNNPTKYTERVSFEISKMLYDMNQEGIQITQPEYSDVEGLETEVETWVTSFTTWLGNATSEGERGIPAESPPTDIVSLADIISAVVACSGGLPAIIVSVFLRVGANLLTRFFEHLLIPETGDLEELTDAIKTAFIQTVGEEEHSILERIANESEQTVILDGGNGNAVTVHPQSMHVVFENGEGE